MRTNALLLAAALAAVGAAQAQVVSQNIVGYVNRTVPNGKYVLIANPLNNGGNTVAEVIKIVGDMTLYHYINGGYVSSTAASGEWVEGGDIVVKPGGGFFAQSTDGTDQKVTFVGEVGVGQTVSIPSGLSLRSSVLPQAGTLTALEYPPTEDTVYQFVNGGYASTQSTGGAWIDPADGPTVAVAESFFVQNDGGPKDWVRTFKIN